MDWIKRIFNDPATMVVLMSSGIIGFVIGISNGVVQKRHGGWPGFFVALTTTVAIALIVGLGTKSYIPSETTRLAIVGVCAFIADDIRAGIMAMGGGFRKDPLGYFMRVLDALRGRASTSTPKE